jgi:hypothetical protein
VRAPKWQDGNGTRRVAAGLTFVVVVTLVVGAMPLAILTDRTAVFALSAGLALSFGLVGYLIARSRPDNAIAWLCLVIAAIWALEGALWSLAEFGLANPGSVAQPEALAALAAPLWVPGIFGIVIFPLLLFPDGRVPSRRLGWLPWMVGAVLVSSYAITVLSDPVTFSWGNPPLESPFAGVLGAWWSPDGPAGFVVDVMFAMLFFAVVAGVAAVVYRLRRSAGVERDQLKWLATAGTASVVGFMAAVAAVDRLGEWVGLVAGACLVLIPISIGVAVLRHRLYDIDRIISRTVSYGLAIGVLATVYAALVVVLGSLLPVSGDLPVAISTLVAAFAFLPLMRRVQRMVDRRFFRSRYDAGVVVARVADELRGSLDPGEVTGRVEAVVDEVFAPEFVVVWVAAEVGA